MTDEANDQKDRRKSELQDLIDSTLRRHSRLHYFQGYHDIAQVLLLVLGASGAELALPRVSLLRIRDYMLPSLKPSMKHLQLIPSILQAADAVLASHLSTINPFYAISSALTLYAHDITEYGDIARLFDFILAHEPVVAIYLFATIVLSQREELLEIDPATEPEMLHFKLSKLPQPIDLEGLIAKCLEAFKLYPPERLPRFAWLKIPAVSVLKSSKTIELLVTQTLEEAEGMFDQQVRILRVEEVKEQALKLVWAYRKPAGSAALAIFVAGISFWLRDSHGIHPLWDLVWRLRRTIGLI